MFYFISAERQKSVLKALNVPFLHVQLKYAYQQPTPSLVTLWLCWSKRRSSVISVFRFLLGRVVICRFSLFETSIVNLSLTSPMKLRLLNWFLYSFLYCFTSLVFACAFCWVDGSLALFPQYSLVCCLTLRVGNVFLYRHPLIVGSGIPPSLV